MNLFRWDRLKQKNGIASLHLRRQIERLAEQ